MTKWLQVSAGVPSVMSERLQWLKALLPIPHALVVATVAAADLEPEHLQGGFEAADRQPLLMVRLSIRILSQLGVE